jgi:hypothetical protein
MPIYIPPAEYSACVKAVKFLSITVIYKYFLQYLYGSIYKGLAGTCPVTGKMTVLKITGEAALSH